MRLRTGNTRLRFRAGGGTTAPTYASQFSVAISPFSGIVGTNVIVTVAPIGGAWPANQAVVGTYSGPGGSFASASVVAGSTASVSFTGSVGTAGTGMINAAISGMTSTGGQGYTATAQTVTPITPSIPTGAGNRFDLVLDRSAAAPGDTVNGLAIINGLWPTASGRTITLSNGVVISLPTGGSSPASFSFTAGSAGEVSLATTNNAGLYPPYPTPLTVFAAGSGSAQSITASLTRLDQVTFQRDTASGTTTGFSSATAKGWGEAWFSIGQAGPALFARIYDAKSGGASTTVGTGTALSNIVQVHGQFAAGVVRVLLPASTYNYFVDLATDAAFTNPVRVAQRFRVGIVVAPMTRSYECGIARQYADSSAFPAVYTNTTTLVAGDSRFGLDGNAGGNSSFFMQGVDASTKVNGDGEGWSSGAEEMGRLLESQLGVAVSICGLAAAGGGFDGQVNHDGSFCAGFTGAVNNLVGGKFRYLYVACEGWDGVDSNYPTQTYAECRTRYYAGIDWIARTYPACAVQGWTVGNSGWSGASGSSALGWQRLQAIIKSEIEPINPMVVSKESSLWNEFVTNHASQAARKDYIRTGFRALMAGEVAAMGGFQTLQRGPILAATGTLNASARTITIGFSVASGASLVALGASYSNPNATYNTASAGEIASTIGVYLTGQYAGNGKAVAISGVTIDNSAKTITIALSGSTGVVFKDGSTGAMSSGFWCNVGADFFASNSTISGSGRGAVLADDRTGNGIPYGWQVRPALDIAVS